MRVEKRPLGHLSRYVFLYLGERHGYKLDCAAVLCYFSEKVVNLHFGHGRCERGRGEMYGVLKQLRVLPIIQPATGLSIPPEIRSAACRLCRRAYRLRPFSGRRECKPRFRGFLLLWLNRDF